MLRNVAGQYVDVLAMSAGVEKTGDLTNIHVYVSKDDGALTEIQSSSTPAGTEINSANAKGMYRFPLQASETDGAKLLFTGRSINASIVPQTIFTAPANFALMQIDSSGNVSAGSTALLSGTATAGAASTITLSAGGSATHDVYVGDLVAITSGTGVGQSRMIVNYDGTTKVATVATPWTIAPNATSVFQVLPSRQSEFIHIGEAQTATAGPTITLQTTASNVSDIYNGQSIRIFSGTGIGQERMIIDYDGVTRIATLDRLWQVVPAALDVYGILQGGSVRSCGGFVDTVTNQLTTVQIAAGVWQDILASGDFGVVNSIGRMLKDDMPIIKNQTMLLPAAPASEYTLTTFMNTVIPYSGLIAGAANSPNGTVTLSSGPATDNFLVGSLLMITSGPGATQAHTIAAYNGTTKVITLDDPFAVVPSAGAQYVIMANDLRPLPIIQALVEDLPTIGTPVTLPDMFGVPYDEYMDCIFAAVVGNCSGRGTATEHYVGRDGDERFVTTFDVDSNRTVAY